MTNQLPDFADETSGDLSEKPGGGFRKLFGSKATGAGAGAAGFSDLERNDNPVPAGGYARDTDDDFEYRGVSNSNNLDSVFRSSGNNTGQNSAGQNSSSASTKQHSRFNSLYEPMTTMHEGGTPFENLETPYPTTEAGVDVFNNSSSETDQDRSSEYHLGDELFFSPQPHPIWQNVGEDHSNNSRLRFTEEI